MKRRTVRQRGRIVLGGAALGCDLVGPAKTRRGSASRACGRSRKPPAGASPVVFSIKARCIPGPRAAGGYGVARRAMRRRRLFRQVCDRDRRRHRSGAMRTRCWWAMATRSRPARQSDRHSPGRETWSTFLDPSLNPPEIRPWGSKALDQRLRHFLTGMTKKNGKPARTKTVEGDLRSGRCGAAERARLPPGGRRCTNGVRGRRAGIGQRGVSLDCFFWGGGLFFFLFFFFFWCVFYFFFFFHFFFFFFFFFFPPSLLLRTRERAPRAPAPANIRLGTRIHPHAS